MNILKQIHHSDKIARWSFFLAIAILTFTIFLSFLLPFSGNQLLICSLGNGLSLLLFLFAYYLAYVFKSDLSNEKKYYLNALHQADSAIAILDKNQRVKWANAQFRKWNGQEKVEGKYFLDITTNQAAKKVMEQLNQPNQLKGAYKSKTFKGIVVKTIINKLKNPPGSYVVIDTDISDLEKADKYQKLVLALFGHDTQKYTRLNLDGVNELYKNYGQDDYLKKELGELLVYAEHSFDLSKNLNDWGDLVFKRGNLVFTKFINLKEEVELVKKRFAIFFKHYGIILDLPFEENLSFHADPDMLRAILRNLISNAIEAILHKQNSPKGHPKIIQISAVKENFQTKISISDTGEGIPPKMQKILFNLDSQSDEVSLGSVLCAYFVEAHSGQIYIDEAESGYTTAISFIIPPKKKQF